MADAQNSDSDDDNDVHVKLLKSKLRQLQEEHRKLIAVTSELTSALQLNIMGQTRNLQIVLDHCSTIYPSLFVSQDVQHNNEFKSNDKLPYSTNDVKDIQCSQLHVNSEGQQNYESAQMVESLKLDDLHFGDEVDQPITPVTEREIKNILEIIFTEAVRYLNQDNTAEVNNCCGVGKACSTCRDEIFDIVESILTKVIESPRFKAAPSSKSISNSRTYSDMTQYRIEASNESSNKMGEKLTSKSWIKKDKNLPKIHTKNLYQLLKENLVKGNIEQKINILRDLRRDLTKHDRYSARTIIKDYIHVDILNIKDHFFLPQELVQADSALLNEQLFRLLNTIASFQQGRNYLCSNNKTVKTILVPKFMQKCNPLARDMLVASLQKLSLQRHMRILMVKEGLLDYLVRFLDESFQNMSLYGIESSIALLMNLCLEDEGKHYCEKNTKKVINLLKNLLRNPATSYVPYINGTLLSLLASEKCYEEAKRQSLDKVIKQLAQGIDNQYLHRQLEYIIQVRFGQQLRFFIGDDDEFLEEDDVLEPELDSDFEEEEDVFDERRSNKSGVCSSKTQTEELLSNETPYRSSTVGNLEAPSINGKAIKHVILAAAGKKHRMTRTPQKFPITSFCYLEICQEIHDGTEDCRCLMCTPGKTRYSCGCYDVIRREISDEIDTICKEQSFNKARNVKKIFGKNSDVENLQQNFPSNQCTICGDKVCDCAFESRPKIHRTPPKT